MVYFRVQGQGFRAQGKNIMFRIIAQGLEKNRKN
jgi:hypothetical protein